MSNYKRTRPVRWGALTVTGHFSREGKPFVGRMTGDTYVPHIQYLGLECDCGSKLEVEKDKLDKLALVDCGCGAAAKLGRTMASHYLSRDVLVRLNEMSAKHGITRSRLADEALAIGLNMWEPGK